MSDKKMFESLTIKGVQPGPHMLILAGVHGDEYEPMAAVRQLKSRIDPQKLTGHVILVPVLNQPAYERINRRGPDDLDLARTFPGSPDGTITEQIAHAATLLIQSVDYLIDLHTGGLYTDLAPFSGYTLHPDQSILETQRRMAHAFNLPVVWGTSPHLDGRTLSAARDHGVPAIYAEWGGGSGCNSQAVAGYTMGCLSVLSELGMLDISIEQKPTTYHIEDDRKESGHLQLQNHAPVAGFFEPAVQLMQRIEVGDKLGSLCSITGEDVTPVTASQTGIIIGIRTLPYVEKDEWLAVILETEN